MDGIIALNKLGYIGLKGKLPWKSLDDLKHFKKLTMGKSLVVGRKTAEKLPKLKGRALYIASSDNPLDSILKMQPDFIIGGAEIFNQSLHLCDTIHVSLIDDETIGDVKFEIPKNLRSKCIYYHFGVNK